MGYGWASVMRCLGMMQPGIDQENQCFAGFPAFLGQMTVVPLGNIMLSTWQ